MSDTTTVMDGGHIDGEYAYYGGHEIRSDTLPVSVGRDISRIVVTCGEERHVFDAGKVAARLLELFASCEVEQ